MTEQFDIEALDKNDFLRYNFISEGKLHSYFSGSKTKEESVFIQFASIGDIIDIHQSKTHFLAGYYQVKLIDSCCISSDEKIVQPAVFVIHEDYDLKDLMDPIETSDKKYKRCQKMFPYVVGLYGDYFIESHYRSLVEYLTYKEIYDHIYLIKYNDENVGFRVNGYTNVHGSCGNIFKTEDDNNIGFCFYSDYGIKDKDLKLQDNFLEIRD